VWIGSWVSLWITEQGPALLSEHACSDLYAHVRISGKPEAKQRLAGFFKKIDCTLHFLLAGKMPRP
jgi:hypothetical protein